MQQIYESSRIEEFFSLLIFSLFSDVTETERDQREESPGPWREEEALRVPTFGEYFFGEITRYCMRVLYEPGLREGVLCGDHVKQPKSSCYWRFTIVTFFFFVNGRNEIFLRE